VRRRDKHSQPMPSSEDLPVSSQRRRRDRDRQPSAGLLSDSLPSSHQNVASHAVAAAAPQFDPTHLNPSVSPFLPGLATSQDSTNLLNSHLTAVPNVYLIIMLPVLPNVMHCNCYHLILSSLMLMLVVSLKPVSQPKCLTIILPSMAFRCIGEIVRNVKVEVFVSIYVKDSIQ